MERAKVVFFLVLGFVAAFAGGCNSNEKAQLAGMQREREEMQTQMNGLRIENNALQTRETDLQNQLAQKDTEIAKREQEIARLRAAGASSAKAPAAPAKPSAPVQASDMKPPGSAAAAPAGWSRSAGGHKATIGGDVLFASGQASLSPAGRTALDRIVADIKAHYAAAKLRVTGYTDSDPISKSPWKSNAELSLARATAVSKYLASKGIAASRIETAGRGAADPVADNKTAAGKAANRRVEIVALP
jgi:flagellar motor protein MotB